MSEEALISGRDYFSEKKRPENFSKNEIVKALSDGKAVLFREGESNQQKFHYCLTWVQVAEIIDLFFSEHSKRAEEFYDYCSNHIVYDGLVFGITRTLLNQCKNSPEDYDSKLYYISHFDYMRHAKMLEFVDLSEEIRKTMSRHPFFRGLNDEEFKQEYGYERSKAL